MPYNNFYNPYGGYQNIQQSQGLLQVVGLEGAKAYQTPLNSTVPLFDSNEAVFYVKTTDTMGNSSVRVFDFQERKPETPSYVTQDEFDTLNNKLDSLLEVINGKSTIPATPTTATSEQRNEPSDGPVQSAPPIRRRKPASSV